MLLKPFATTTFVQLACGGEIIIVIVVAERALSLLEIMINDCNLDCNLDYIIH